MPRQLRLLLWKDYLTRKRKIITLAGIVWATAVIVSIYIVRTNVDNVDFPTCQFPARALPSAGMLPFLQSFICSVNNDCEPLDKFDEIPTYENSKLTQLQRQFSPLLNNETILDVAGTVPDALKLLSKLAEIVDEPTFIDVSKNGLKVRDLFTSPSIVKRYLSSKLSVDEDVMKSVMSAELSFQGILKGSINRCNPVSISETLTMNNTDHLTILSERLCNMTEQDMQQIVMDLMREVDFHKFITMLGNMYEKLSGDVRVTSLADTVTAVLRMTKVTNFLPTEVAALAGAETDFTYFPLDLIKKFVDIFKPTFEDTESFKAIKDFADTIVMGLKYLNQFVTKTKESSLESKDDASLKTVNKALDNVMEVFQQTVKNESSIDVFNVLAQVTKFVHRWLPNDLKHEVLLYSTLLAKLIEGATNVISINMNIEERTYNVALRHPEGVKILVGLPSAIIAKCFDGLADAERTQVMTSKINTPGQMFCDVNRLQNFLKISKEDAANLKTKLCTDAWKNFVTDLIRSFGIYDVKNNINAMASILIQETLGKDTSEKMYTFEHDFNALKNFTQSLTKMTQEEVHSRVNWQKLFNVTKDSEFMQTVRRKGHLGKQMLVTVHGALAKEVVNQNLILSYKITPGLIDTTILVVTLNNQLDQASKPLVDSLKEMYPKILETIVRTALVEEKTYKSLSTFSRDIMCNGVEEASNFLELPANVDQEKLVRTMCDISSAIEDGLEKDSILGKALASIRNTEQSFFDEVQWTTLINGLKNLYVQLDRDFPYLFEYDSYGMDEGMKQKIKNMVEHAKKLWFGEGAFGRSLHLGLNMAFRVLDLADRELFNVTSEPWLMTKYSLHTLSPPLSVAHDFVQTVSAFYRNESYPSNLPTSTVAALNSIVPNIPQLLTDGVDIVIQNQIELDGVISLLNAEVPWPCSGSLSELLPLSAGSIEAVLALETILCMDHNFTEQWTDYLAEKNVTTFNIKNFNTTAYPRSVFLKFSSALDGLIEDVTSLKAIVNDVTDHEDGPWMQAWRSIVAVFRREDRDDIMKNFLSKVDTALSSVSTPTSTSTVYSLWSDYLKCARMSPPPTTCSGSARAAWKRALQYVSTTVSAVTDDLYVYFDENNDPNHNLLQVFGFTKGTPLYELYEHLPDYVAVLVHSYFDYAFMSQIRRAALTQFWDCEAVLGSVVIPPYSRVDRAAVKRIEPYVCVSFLYWLGLPRNDNKLLDVVAKPNYYFFTSPADNLTSHFENAYTNIIKLTNLLTDIANKNVSLITEEEIKANTIQYKFEKVIDQILNYRINETDEFYRIFYVINKHYFALSIYLTRVASIVNKIAVSIEEFNVNNTELQNVEERAKVEADLSTLKKSFKRRPVDIVALHFDILTDVIWTNDKEYTLVKALESSCNDGDVTNKTILVDNKRVKNQICSKNYKEIYKVIEKDLVNDYADARISLLTLVKILQGADERNVTDIFQYINERQQLVSSFQTSIKHSYELSIPIYLQYLQSNLRHYDVITSFLSGGDWWGELRGLYDGPRATEFLDSVEHSFETAEEVLTGLDRIHLVRILRDINVNESDTFCNPSIVLSDYVPDSAGRLSTLKARMCEEDKVQLFKELPPLLYASQGYESSLRISKDVNYTSLQMDLSKTEANLDLITKDLKSPQRPPWVTEDKIKHFREVAVNLLSRDSVTRMAFGVLSNVVDGGTLFLNMSQCPLCSQLTSWLKQINLQVFKKQEYDGLLCRMPDLNLRELKAVLHNDFHWDMAVTELIQTRNYTKNELNKSLNEFLELVKLHLLEDMNSGTAKLADCLLANVTRNEFGNVTLFLSILSHTSRMLRAETPYLQDIPGFTSLPYFKKLSEQIAPRLDVYRPVKEYLVDQATVKKQLEVFGGLGKDLLSDDFSLRLYSSKKPVNEYAKLHNNKWEDVCKEYDCNEITKILEEKFNKTMIVKKLPTLQNQEFWRFPFVSRILKHIELALSHMGRVTAVLSHVEWQGRLQALLDFAMQLLMDDVATDVVYSIQGLLEEFQPLIKNTTLENDLRALSTGLTVLVQFKNYALKEMDLKLEVSQLFSRPERIEYELGRLGINNTNFWSLAAPRILAGRIDLKQLFTPRAEFHISAYFCDIDTLSTVLEPAALDAVSADDVSAAVVEQLCATDDDTAKKIIQVLVGNLNFTTVIHKVADILLPQLYASANLTLEQGSAVLDKYPAMASLLPVIQSSVGDLGTAFAKEPLVQSLGEASNLGGLLGSPKFLSNAGQMMCGKPFQTDMNRFYKAITETKDFTEQVDQEQLNVLPTDFCRDLYKDITSMGGGKIIWKFVKPLIMGKILYTPVNPVVQRIVEQANSTFAYMIKLTSLIHSFSASFPTLDDLSAHREGLSALRRIITSPALGDFRNMLIGDSPLPEVDTDGLFDDFGDLKGIGSLLKKGSDLLRCFDLDRFKPVSDEFQMTHEAVKLSRVDEFSAGLVFLNTEGKSDMKNVEYKIRMDIENTPTTARLKNYLWIPGPESSFIEHMRYFRGFIQIQDLVDNAIIRLFRSNSSRAKRESRTEDKWAVYTQQEPYPCYRKDFFQTSLYESQALMVGLFVSLLFTVASTVRFIVADTETGNTMLLSVMGVNLTWHTLSWFLTSLVELTLTVACMTFVLHWGSILPNTAPTVVAAILFVFAFSVLAFCYMMSKLFKSASLAAVCSAIAYLMTFMPFVLILSLEAVLGYGLKMIVCLSMSTSICYAFLNITRAEARGVSTDWADIARTEDGDLSILVACSLALVDAAIYTAIGMLLDRLFGPKTRSSITHSKTSGEKAGVSIVNITKVYNKGGRREKMALDNVSIELHKGQITTLLGHNGAGKTTLIKILTGMAKPTSGHIVVRSDTLGRAVGVCPQNNVLFEALTAAEHVALYAQLKTNLPLELLREEIDSILSVLSLGAVCGEPVSRLSGGTRRRVCVALAFVCRPALVTLDEPTAGVDPANRRDIWAMITKLREGRTILLTTHHLDEAEMLSDQIVILHKGQVHTSGSPIDIKRSLGSGYRLCVSYTRGAGAGAGAGAGEERAQALVRAVRAIVPNARLLRAHSTLLMLSVPFYDDNGLNNDFLRLCTDLEARQSELEYSSYSLDCSSLEQVFFKVTQNGPQDCEAETTSKSASTSSVQSEQSPLVPNDGPLRGGRVAQLTALLQARYTHYLRNHWLLFLLIVLPSVFVTVAMAFSTIRPPADNEVALPLTPDLYKDSTEYLVSEPTIYSNTDPTFAQKVLSNLKLDGIRQWLPSDTPNCNCSETKQVCQEHSVERPSMIQVPDVKTLNEWIVGSHDDYIDKRYGGFTAALKNNMTYLISWYNNKGHHAMPAYLNALNNAILRSVGGGNITVYSHPLKISPEQLSKDTVYQHVADAGISALVLLAYALVSAGAAIYLVSARSSQQQRLQLLCGVSPLAYWAAALLTDMTIIVINMVITVIVFEAFGFPVFVARNNLPAICLLILLYGFSCGSLMHVVEKLFTEASLANMLLFCGNAFVGFAGITLLLILDIISESEATDNARWTLHKVLLLFPQFALADGMLELAKNTVQAQVLIRFGMDTYKDPLSTDLIMLHYISMTVVGAALFLLNLAIEYDCFEGIIVKFRKESIPEPSGEMEDLEVSAERKRVQAALLESENAVRLPTLGNINAGFVDTEVKNNSIKRIVCAPRDVAACVGLSKAYPTLAGNKFAVKHLTIGIPPGQCTALLGQNGAGKSTTFAMLTGQVRPSAGLIYLNGAPANPTTLCKGLISYCPQSDAIDPLLTVRETLLFYCKLRGIEDQQKVISRTMQMFELSCYAEVRSGALSGGNKRKLCTAIAFMGRSPLVLLDEPTSGMDPMSRACVWRGAAAAAGGGARGVLLSTHALHDARRLAARVALLRAGRLCALASLDDCLKRFGGGYIVACRCGADARGVWRAVRAAAPQARLKVLHHSAIHFLLPTTATVGEKEVTTTASDIFRLMARLQAVTDIENYTINQTSLDQMFLSFTDKGDEDLEPTYLESLPTIETEIQSDQNSITPL